MFSESFPAPVALSLVDNLTSIQKRFPFIFFSEMSNVFHLQTLRFSYLYQKSQGSPRSMSHDSILYF